MESAIRFIDSCEHVTQAVKVHCTRGRHTEILEIANREGFHCIGIYGTSRPQYNTVSHTIAGFPV